LEAQTATVRAYVEQRRGRLIGEFSEARKAGGRAVEVVRQQPALAAAIDLCRASAATLLVARLDRLTRNVAFLAELVEKGPPFVVVELPEVSPMALHIYAALAEEERRRIAARVQPSADRKAQAALAFAERFRSDVNAAVRAGARTVADIAAALNARRFVTSAGYSWTADSAGTLLRRLKGTYDRKHIPGRRSTGAQVQAAAAVERARAVYPEILELRTAGCRT
jgi:DNA invertase Pin-like site-specific DNA recombinase